MKTFFKTALMAGVALSAGLFSGTALGAYHSDVVTCKHDEICHYLSDDGNVYDWNDNLVAPSAGSFIGTDGQELVRTGESSAPFTAVSSSYAGRSFVDQMSFSYVNYFLDSSNVLRFCYFGCAHYWPAWGDVKDFDLWAQGNTAAIVFMDGTSNVCTWNDNVSVSVSSGDYNNGDWQRFVCKKTDGTFETSLDSGAEPPECAKSAHGKRFQDWQPASFLYVKADDTLAWTNVGIPSGRWRDVILVKRSLSCWVSITDRLFKCWDENGNFIKTSTHTVAESVGRPQSVSGCEWTEPTGNEGGSSGNSGNGSSVRSGVADAVLDALGLTDLVSGGRTHATGDEQKAKAEKYSQFLASPDFTAKVSAAGNSKVLWVDLSNWNP